MKKVLNFVKGKKEEKTCKINPQISVEITNPSGQKIATDDEHIIGLQQGYGYNIDISGKDKNMLKIHKAAWFGNLDKLKLHLKKTDVTTVDAMGRTCLHLAVAQGHTEVAWYLLNNNASTTACDNDGLTPFLKAIECGQKDCTNLLIECGVDVNSTDKNGNTGLHIAARSGFYNIASLLLKEGASLNIPNNTGEYPLHLATSGDHREMVELLIRCSANVEVLDRERRTPLMLAARNGLTMIIKVLIDNGARLDTLDSNGWTAEDYAQFGGHQELMELLEVRKSEEPVLDHSDKLSVHSSDQSEHVNFENVSCNGKASEDSPKSCVIPPPLDPPRSWDLINSGIMDRDNTERKNLSLGNLKKCIDHGSGDLAVTRSEGGHSSLSPSGDGIPLDMRLSPEPLSLAPTPERRTRSPLERVNSLDLPSDQDSPIQGYTAEELQPLENKTDDSINEEHLTNMNENTENNNTIAFNTTQNNVNLALNLDIKSLSKFSETLSQSQSSLSPRNEKNLFHEDQTYTIESSQSFDNLDGRRSYGEGFPGASASLDNIEDIDGKSLSIEIIQSTGNLGDTLSVCTTSKNFFRESHSLELLEGSEARKSKKHARNKSITLSGQPQFWKSVDMLPKPVFDRESIDAQLQCYDEALRQLAEANVPKEPEPEPQLVHDDSLDLQMNYDLESLDRDFPPPPIHFLESDELKSLSEVSQLVDSLPLPISMLTPIKETQIECDSLSNAENVDESESLQTLSVHDKSETPSHFNVEVIVNNKSGENGLPRPEPDEFLEESTLPEHFQKYFVDVKALQLKPTEVDLQKVVIPSESPVRTSESATEKPNKSDSESEVVGRPIRKKRKLLLAMRGAGVGGSKDTDNDIDDDDDIDNEDDSDEDDPPFWLSTEKGGYFLRQNTILAMPSGPAHLSNEDLILPGPSQSKIGLRSVTPSGSSIAETASPSDTPKLSPSVAGLKHNLYEANDVKEQLEETAVSLIDKAARLKYELEDSRQAEAAREDTISILQNQLMRLECRYAKAQEELCTLRQRASNAEHELQHLRELCSNLTKDRAEMYRELSMHFVTAPKMDSTEDCSQKHLQLMIKHLEDSKTLEEEKNRRLVHHLEEVLVTNQNMISEREALIAQNIADVRKLQEDTICWKDRYEELAAKLEMMDKKQDPRLVEAQDTIATLKRTIAILQQEKSMHKFDSPSSPATPADSRDSKLYRSTLEYIQTQLVVLKQQIDSQMINLKSSLITNLALAENELSKLNSNVDNETAKLAELSAEVSKILEEVQYKVKFNQEVEGIQRKLRQEYVSKADFETLRVSQHEALNRIKQEVVSESQSQLTEKLAEINELIQRQMEDQARIERARSNNEISLRQKFEHMGNVLQTELNNIQTVLKAKEAEEQVLIKKCEHLTKEVEKHKQRQMSLEKTTSEFRRSDKSADLSNLINDQDVQRKRGAQSIEDRFNEDLKEKYLQTN